MSTNEDTIVRCLRRHLDKQATGFPAPWRGSHVRHRKRVSTRIEE